MLAAKNGNESSVQILVNYGPLIDAVNDMDQTLLALAELDAAQKLRDFYSKKELHWPSRMKTARRL